MTFTYFQCIYYCCKRPSEAPIEKNHDPYYEQKKMHPEETVPVYYPSAPTAAPPSPMQTEMVVVSKILVVIPRLS